jgi:TMEM199 family protein
MARLRREEEARAYDRMIKPAPTLETSTFSQRFPTASAAYAFSSTAAYESFNTSTTEEDDITYTDVNRQITLIFNVLVSIVCCAAAIWIAAKWWDTPARLALSMSGSLLVGVAEVAVYSGYIRRLGEAKGREGKVREVKEIVKTWVVGGEGEKEEGNVKQVGLVGKEDQNTLRERKQWKEPPG